MIGALFPKSSTLSSHKTPSKRGWSWASALFMLVTAAALVAWAPEAGAYEQYSLTGGNNASGNCADCHGDFNGANYTSIKDGTPWNDDLHDGHRRDSR